MVEFNNKSLQESVAALPERYQPIFGHAESVTDSSRACEDRLETIASVYVALQEQLGRPLKVLDLGCAQGYFTFSLAKLGAAVTGVDYLEENISVCTELRDLNPDLDVRFKVGKIENVGESIQHGEYDLVLGLSVFHHLVHEHGQEYVVRLLTEFAGKTLFALFEFALDSEPLYWADSLPSDQRSLLRGFAFVHELALHPTHLSEVWRPLFFASNQYWFLDGQAGEFDSWSDKSHRLVENTHFGTRRYFFSADSVIKLFLINCTHLDKINLADIRNESNFLDRKNLPIPVPKLRMSGENGEEAWLVRDLIPGRLLVDLILEGDEFDPAFIIEKVLLQLASLEDRGLFHNDLRTWNILIATDGTPVLMDYASISSSEKDCCWPEDLILNFFIFVYEVVTRSSVTPVHGRQPFISPYNLPEPYYQKFVTFWTDPVREWSFKALTKHFQESAENIEQDSVRLAEQRWKGAIETRLADMTTYSSNLYNSIEDLNNQMEIIKNRLHELNQALETVYTSRSWKITAPLRRASQWVKKLGDRN